MSEEKKELTDDQKAVQDDFKKYQAINAIANQDGGKILIKSLETDVVAGVEMIISLYKGDEMELRVTIAKLSANLNLLRAFKRSAKNEEELRKEVVSLLEE